MEEYEIDLRKLFRALWARKRIIISWTIFLTVVSVFFIFITAKPKYKSEGVLVAYYSGQAELTKEMLESLVLTDEVMSELILNLDLRDKFNKHIAPNALKKGFSIESINTVYKVGVQAQKKVPEYSTIVVSATTSDPQMSKKILDAWIELITKNISQIFGKKLNEERLKSVENQLRKAQAEFEKISREYTQFLKTNHSYYSMKTRINVLSQKIDDYENKVYQLKVDVGANKKILENLKKKLSEMEENNRWVGLFFVKADTVGSELRDKIIKVKNDVKTTDDLIAAFKIKSMIDFREANLNTLKSKLNEYNNELLDAKVQLAVLNDRRENIIKELKDKKMYIPVAKGISDETVWSQLISGSTSFDKIKGVKIISQSINPIYMSLQQKLTDINIDYYTTKLKIQHLKKQIAELQKKISEESETLQKDQLKLEEYNKMLSILNPIYDKFKKQYIDLQTQIVDLSSKVWQLESQYEFYKKTLEDAKRELAKLQADYNSLQAEKDLLETKYNATRGIFISLQEQKQTLESTLGNGGVSIYPIAYGSVPTEPLPRHRAMKALIALIVSFMIGLFMAFLNYYFKEEG